MSQKILDKNKILFLWMNQKAFFSQQAQKQGVKTDRIYKKIPSFLARLRRYHIKKDWPFFRIWLKQWTHNLQEYDIVIIHANYLTPAVVKYIRSRCPEIRIIVWYWNPVDKCVPIQQFDKKSEIWSFDEVDCKKYHLKYNTQYYYKDIGLPKTQEKNRALFVGRDKGRLAQLIELKELLAANQVDSYFHITSTRAARVGENNGNNQLYKEFLSYEEILHMIAESKAIIDYVSENQSGLTMRPLEAIFFEKKLITNDQSIVKRDFYTKNNIFVIGKDDPAELKQFMDSAYQKIDEKIVEQYDFEQWLGRFFNDG